MVEKEKTVAAIGDFIRKLLKLDQSDSLVNILKTLFYCFGRRHILMFIVFEALVDSGID